MKVADYKCNSCDKILRDVFMDEVGVTECKCGSVNLSRIFSFGKYKEFQVGLYENFEHKPIYIESRQQFKEECKKRNLERVF